jgi:hypothetical protein
VGIGERAALVAKQLALEQRVRQRAAVDGDEARFAAPRKLVDPTREDLFARAALSTVASVCAVIGSRRSSFWMAGVLPTITVPPCAAVIACRSSRTSRASRTRSSCVRTRLAKTSWSTGLGM